MKRKIKKFEYPLVFALGGVSYIIIELLWRGKTHWTMALCGGLCFYCLYLVESKLKTASRLEKCLFGCICITLIEFITGCIVNKIFKLNVWDYSEYRFNIFGQICLYYSFLWFILCIPAFQIAKTLKKKFF